MSYSFWRPQPWRPGAPAPPSYATATASIWIEIWGSWIQVKKNSIFTDKFPIKVDFFRKFHKKIDFPGKFPKTFDFFRQFKKNYIFQAKISHLQLPLGKLLYFSSKVTTFEHTSCTW